MHSQRQPSSPLRERSQNKRREVLEAGGWEHRFQPGPPQGQKFPITLMATGTLYLARILPEGAGFDLPLIRGSSLLSV